MVVGAAQAADVLAQGAGIAFAADDAKLLVVGPDTAGAAQILGLDALQGVAGDLG